MEDSIAQTGRPAIMVSTHMRAEIGNARQPLPTTTIYVGSAEKLAPRSYSCTVTRAEYYAS